MVTIEVVVMVEVVILHNSTIINSQVVVNFTVAMAKLVTIILLHLHNPSHLPLLNHKDRELLVRYVVRMVILLWIATSLPSHEFCLPRKTCSSQARSTAATASANQNSNWLTDTRASDHITPDLSQLSLTQQLIAGESVTVRNGQELPVTHIGNALNAGFAYREGPLQRAE